MEKQKIHLQKAKTWNMVSMVMKGIFLIFTVSSLFLTITGKGELFDKAYTLVNALISIAVFVMYLSNNKKLTNGETAAKLPYYLYLGWAVVTTIYSIMTSSSIEVPEVAGVDMSSILMTSIVIVIIGKILVALPAIITLVHLFKADTKE